MTTNNTETSIVAAVLSAVSDCNQRGLRGLVWHVSWSFRTAWYTTWYTTGITVVSPSHEVKLSIPTLASGEFIMADIPATVDRGVVRGYAELRDNANHTIKRIGPFLAPGEESINDRDGRYVPKRCMELVARHKDCDEHAHIVRDGCVEAILEDLELEFGIKRRDN